jgi:hypothetical protein
VVQSSWHADALQGSVKMKQWGGNGSQTGQFFTHAPAAFLKHGPQKGNSWGMMPSAWAEVPFKR